MFPLFPHLFAMKWWNQMPQSSFYECWVLSQLFHFHQYFPSGSDGKASAFNVGDPGSIPRWGRSSGEENGNPLQYSCLENPMYGGACMEDSSPWGRKESDPEWLIFTFIKRLTTSSLSAIRMVSSAYLKLLIFFPSLESSLSFIQPCISHDILCKEISMVTIYSLDVLLSQFWTSLLFHVHF